jgi:UDP-glucuronate 4-epimerase
MVNKVENFVYASSSSVYGKNKKVPFSVDDRVDNPVSLYAATKRCNELVAYTYNHVYGLPTTGLRFFTVYGTWGRPDMALFLFTKAILAGEPITVYNYGRMQRDFTYVSDIVDGILAALKHPQPFGIYNLGNSQRVSLNKFIGHIEQKLGIKAKKKLIPMQMGDVPCTYADISSAQKDLHFSPKIGIKEGINDFIDWYRSYYKE